MESHPDNPSRTDRKTIEKNRRNQMKSLFSKLNSLVPHDHHSRETLTLPEQLDEAAKYIKKLQVGVERLKEKKRRLMGMERSSSITTSSRSTVVEKPPRMEVHEIGCVLEIVVVTGLDQKFIFNDVIRVLHEDGAEIVNAGFSVVDDDTVFHTIYCKVEECGMGNAKAANTSLKLKKLIYDLH